MKGIKFIIFVSITAIGLIVLLLSFCERKVPVVPQADKHIPDSTFHKKPLPIIAIPEVQKSIPAKVDVYKADSVLRKQVEKKLQKGNIVTGQRITRKTYEIAKIDTAGKGFIETHPIVPGISIIEIDMHGNVKITTDKRAVRKMKWQRRWATVKTTAVVVGTAVVTVVVTVLVIEATDKDFADNNIADEAD